MLEPQSFCSNEVESEDMFKGNWTGAKSDTLLVGITFHFRLNFLDKCIPSAWWAECAWQWRNEPWGEHQHLPGAPAAGEPGHRDGRQQEEMSLAPASLSPHHHHPHHQPLHHCRDLHLKKEVPRMAKFIFYCDRQRHNKNASKNDFIFIFFISIISCYHLYL